MQNPLAPPFLEREGRGHLILAAQDGRGGRKDGRNATGVKEQQHDEFLGDMDITMRPNGKSALPDSQRIEFLAFLVLAASLRGLARTNKTPIQIVLPISHAPPHPPTIKIKSHPSIPPD